TSGAYQTTALNSSSTAAFVSQLDSSGHLSYSTLLYGTSPQVHGMGIAVTSSGNAVVTGDVAVSTGFGQSFATTTGSFQPNPGLSTGTQAFVTELNSTLSSLAFSSYLGGSSNSYGRAVAVDASNNVYLAGQSGSGLPTTLGAYQTSDPSLGANAFA